MVKERKDESEKGKKIEKESDLKKFLKKRSFLYLMCAVVFVVFFVPDMIAPSELERKTTESLDNDEEKYAWNIVKSYKGTDDKGSTLGEILLIQIENTYPHEKIFEHNDTVIEISAIDAQDEVIDGVYQVHFSFKTYDNDRDYVWHVNIQTGEIFPINDGARKMMNIVEYYN
jgi:hypothetical protein